MKQEKNITRAIEAENRDGRPLSPPIFGQGWVTCFLSQVFWVSKNGAQFLAGPRHNSNLRAIFKGQ